MQEELKIYQHLVRNMKIKIRWIVTNRSNEKSFLYVFHQFLMQICNVLL